MYVPKQFQETRSKILIEAISDIRLAALVTCGSEGPHVTHVPMVPKANADGTWSLETHVARPNPHWKMEGSPTVAVFQGPHAYVSPSWYAAKREHGKVVPTWNYIAVHAHGVLEAIEEEAWLLRHLNDLTRANEAGRDHSWEVSDAPADFISGLTRAIVGLRLRVGRLEGAWKMIQHRSEADRLGVIAGLRSERPDVAAVMEGLEAARRLADPIAPSMHAS